MINKVLKRTPIEIFCHDCGNLSDDFKLAIQQQYCKYIKGTCCKPRKSEPEIKVGICSLGATVAQKNEIQPVIICPQRFKEEVMFDTIRKNYLSHWKNIKWVQEVSIGVGGSVDYVAIEIDKNDNVKDFLCVEIQAAGTTGSPYPAVKEFISNSSFVSKKYSYGINWANEFSKTMMQQAYKKGKIVESWNRKIVFVVQDLAMDYLYHATDCSKVTDSNFDFPIDFCTFKMNWNGASWNLSFDKIRSTTIEGISAILGGAPVNEYPTENEFIESITKKGIADGILKLK